MAKKKSEVIESATPRIEWIRLHDLKRWPKKRNPKNHDVALLRQLFATHGFKDFPTVDEGTGQIVEGNGRAEALLAMKQDDPSTPPENVRLDEDGEWLVPVVRGMSFGDEKQAQAYLLAHNHVHDKGGYDKVDLTALLLERKNEGDLRGVGYTIKEIDSLIRKHSPEEADTRPQIEGLAYRILVDVADEQQQGEVMEMLRGEGFKCKAVIQ
jgi:hypothetical protein